MRPTRPFRLAGAAFALSLTAAAAQAQSPAPAQAPAVTAPAADTVVGRIGDQEIHLGELSEAAQTLPDELKGLPPSALYPLLLDQMLDRKALVIEARKLKLQDEPAVKQSIAQATDLALQNAVLSRDIGPLVTDAALHAKYDATYANKPGEEEVHAAHILVPTEEEAKQIIAELNKGADFAALAKEHSKDPAAQQGGDLGFFKKADMVPEFADVAFGLKPGEVSPNPVKTQFGWHVIKVLERRTAPAPSFEQAREDIRQDIIQDAIRKVVDKAKAGLKIERFKADGTPLLPPAPTPAVAAPPPPASQPGLTAPPQPPVK